jgi:hypothetical protein
MIEKVLLNNIIFDVSVANMPLTATMPMAMLIVKATEFHLR